MDWVSIFDEIKKRNVRELLLEMQSILKYDIGENNCFTIEELINILNQKQIAFSKNDLHIALYILLNDFGSIVRHDSWNAKPRFQVLDERHRETIWQKSFYDFNDDSNEDKKFLLISDTHIGNSKMQNFKLINNIYDFALKNGIKNIFHLGDVFEGIDCNDSEKEKMIKIEKQVNLFKNYYPNLEPDELRTISLLGNHDKTIYGTYGTDVLCEFDNMKPQLYDLRSVTKDNPGFIFYARKNFSLNLNNIPIHFSHRLYINNLHREVKIKKTEDITEKVGDIDCRYPLNFSGHLHNSLLYKNGGNNEQLFVGVPSTSSLNSGNVVAYIININGDECYQYIHITIVNSTTDDKITIGDTYIYRIEKQHDTNKRMIKKII